MKKLDRDCTPVRFTVLTSVAGGLVLAGILAIIRSGVLVAKLPAWTVLVVGMLVAAPLLLRRTPWTRRTRQAFLVTSAFSQKYWIAGLVQRMHGVLDRNGIDLVLKVPDRDYDAAAQAHHLRRILAARHDYIGGIIIATDVHRSRPDLTEFCSEFALPVVFTDIEPFDDENRYPDNAAFVGYLSSDLGTLAGRWLVAHLRQHSRRRPHVLIIASQEHPTRQTLCAEILLAELTDVSITVNDSCAFQRSRAYDAVQSHIRLSGASEVAVVAVRHQTARNSRRTMTSTGWRSGCSLGCSSLVFVAVRQCPKPRRITTSNVCEPARTSAGRFRNA